MVYFGHARTASLLLVLARLTSAFTPPRASTGANVVASSPPKAISIPVEPTATSAPWDRTKEKGAAATGGRDDWVRNLNYDAFAKDVAALGKELQKSSGPDDVEHLNKVRYRTTYSRIAPAKMIIKECYQQRKLAKNVMYVSLHPPIASFICSHTRISRLFLNQDPQLAKHGLRVGSGYYVARPQSNYHCRIVNMDICKLDHGGPPHLSRWVQPRRCRQIQFPRIRSWKCNAPHC